MLSKIWFSLVPKRRKDDGEDFSEERLRPEEYSSVSFQKVALLLGILFAYLPIASLLGFCRWDWGARAYSPTVAFDLPFYFIVSWAGLHAVLVWPVDTLLYPNYQSKLSRPFRVLLVMMLLGPPVFSFAYYYGQIRGAMDLQEVFTIVVPAIAIAAILYDECRLALVFSFFLAIALFLPLFVVGDVLAPFPVLVSYSSNGFAFYFLRALFPSLALWLTLRWAWQASQKTNEPWPGFSAVLITLFAYGVGLEVLWRSAQFFLDKDSIASPVGNPLWLGLPPLIYFLSRPQKFNYRFVLALAVPQLFITLFCLVTFVVGRQATGPGLAWFGYRLVGFAILVELCVACLSFAGSRGIKFPRPSST